MDVYNEATDLLDAIVAFEKAKEGDSGDAEFDAACEMRDAALKYLRGSAQGNAAVVDLITRYDAVFDQLANNPDL